MGNGQWAMGNGQWAMGNGKGIGAERGPSHAVGGVGEGVFAYSAAFFVTTVPCGVSFTS
jgi:hypothetical protein